MSPKKPLTHAPRNPQRRSREERQALEREESERRQARTNVRAEQDGRRANYARNAAAEERWRESAADRGLGLGGSLRYVRDGGRGGFMGQNKAPTQTARKQGVPAPMTSTTTGSATNQASVIAENSSTTTRNPTRPPRRRGGRAASAGTKRTPIIKAEPDDVTIVAADSVAEPVVKREHYDISDSSDEEMAAGKNVEHMNLVSEDEDDEDSEDGDEDVHMAGALPPSSTPIATRPKRDDLVPVRMPRKEHRDRNLPFGMKDVASPTAARKVKPDPDIEMITERKITRTSTLRMDVDDEDDEEEEDVSEDDEELEDLAPLPGGGISEDQEDKETSETESKQVTTSKARADRRGQRSARTKPIFQSEAEVLEHLKQQRDLEILQRELANIDPATTEETTTENESVRKEGAVYLFQFPPIIPDLYDPRTDPEPAAAIASPNLQTAKKSTGRPADPIKIEEMADANLDGPPALSSISPKQTTRLSPGLAGQLVVYKSGRTLLKWGNTSMEVSLGTMPHFLQTVVLADVPSNSSSDRNINGNANANDDIKLNGAGAAGQVMDIDGDESSAQPEAVSFGQIRGKFVVTPNWEEILR